MLEERTVSQPPPRRTRRPGGYHMHRIWSTVAILVFVGTASAGSAQTAVEPLPSGTITISTADLMTAPDLLSSGAAERDAEVLRWVEEFTDWQKWAAQWGNRRERGVLTGFRERRQVPIPPDWLPASCATVLDDSDRLARACALLIQWREDIAITLTRQARDTAAAQTETPQKTVWWEQVHVDLLWPAMQWQASVYGVVGMHMATTVKNRLQVFITPGAMLLNLPTRSGSRAWKVATNYGIGYRLFDFTFPGGRPAALHVNLAKAWVLSDITDVVTGRSMDFVGFSIAFKQAP